MAYDVIACDRSDHTKEVVIARVALHDQAVKVKEQEMAKRNRQAEAGENWHDRITIIER
jgi:hypothetical protein